MCYDYTGKSAPQRAKFQEPRSTALYPNPRYNEARYKEGRLYEIIGSRYGQNVGEMYSCFQESIRTLPLFYSRTFKNTPFVRFKNIQGYLKIKLKMVQEHLGIRMNPGRSHYAGKYQR